MQRPHLARTAALSLVATFAAACTFAPRTPQPITPQRPTFSVDANTTAVGSAELEAGLALDPGDAMDLPAVVKWGASERTELLAAFSPYRRIFVDGNDPDGIGDLLLGTKHRFVDETEELPGAAVQVLTKLPTAPTNGVGSGEIDFFVAATATKTFESLTATAFYQLGVVGQPGLGDTEIEHGFAGAISMPFEDSRFAFTGEAALILRPETDIEILQATGSVSYFVSDAMALDAGLIVGLSEEAPDAVLLLGMVRNFGAVQP